MRKRVSSTVIVLLLLLSDLITYLCSSISHPKHHPRPPSIVRYITVTSQSLSSSTNLDSNSSIFDIVGRRSFAFGRRLPLVMVQTSTVYRVRVGLSSSTSVDVSLYIGYRQRLRHGAKNSEGYVVPKMITYRHRQGKASPSTRDRSQPGGELMCKVEC